MNVLRRPIVALAALFMASGANAVPVKWNLVDVTFDDGGSSTGSFVYEVDTLSLSEINITTTGGTSFGGAVYAFEHSAFTGFGADGIAVISEVVGDLSGETWLGLNLTADPMTNAGGTIPLTSGFFSAFNEYSCPDAACGPGGSPGLRGTAGGSISSVPVPAAVWLFGSAIGVLGWIRRKRL